MNTAVLFISSDENSSALGPLQRTSNLDYEVCKALSRDQVDWTQQGSTTDLKEMPAGNDWNLLNSFFLLGLV